MKAKLAAMQERQYELQQSIQESGKALDSASSDRFESSLRNATVLRNTMGLKISRKHRFGSDKGGSHTSFWNQTTTRASNSAVEDQDHNKLLFSIQSDLETLTGMCVEHAQLLEENGREEAIPEQGR